MVFGILLSLFLILIFCVGFIFILNSFKKELKNPKSDFQKEIDQIGKKSDKTLNSVADVTDYLLKNTKVELGQTFCRNN